MAPPVQSSSPKQCIPGTYGPYCPDKTSWQARPPHSGEGDMCLSDFCPGKGGTGKGTKAENNGRVKKPRSSSGSAAGSSNSSNGGAGIDSYQGAGGNNSGGGGGTGGTVGNSNQQGGNNGSGGGGGNGGGNNGGGGPGGAPPGGSGGGEKPPRPPGPGGGVNPPPPGGNGGGEKPPKVGGGKISAPDLSKLFSGFVNAFAIEIGLNGLKLNPNNYEAPGVVSIPGTGAVGLAYTLDLKGFQAGGSLAYLITGVEKYGPSQSNPNGIEQKVDLSFNSGFIGKGWIGYRSGDHAVHFNLLGGGIFGSRGSSADTKSNSAERTGFFGGGFEYCYQATQRRGSCLGLGLQILYFPQSLHSGEAIPDPFLGTVFIIR